MNSITTDDFAAYQMQRIESVERTAQRRSKKNPVLIICVLLVHAVAVYAVTHMKVTSPAAAIVPIEVQFIEEASKPKEARTIASPAHFEINAITPVMPILDTAAPEAPAPSVAIPVTPVTNVVAQTSDGATSASPKLVSEVAYIRAPKPKYPSAARSLRLAGTVVLRILIDERGRPAQVSVHRSSGHRVLDDAAHDAAVEALFRPYVEDGVVRQVFVLVPIEFGARSG